MGNYKEFVYVDFKFQLIELSNSCKVNIRDMVSSEQFKNKEDFIVLLDSLILNLVGLIKNYSGGEISIEGFTFRCRQLKDELNSAMQSISKLRELVHNNLVDEHLISKVDLVTDLLCFSCTDIFKFRFELEKLSHNFVFD